MKRLLLHIILIFFVFNLAVAQDEKEKAAFDILDKAIGFIFENQNGAIYYEGLTFGIDNPLDIFTLPVYEVHRGGFWIWNKDRFEMQLGVVKALCDGKLMVVVDEKTGTMIVDSLRTETPLEYEEKPDIDQLIMETFGEGQIKSLGKETVNGRQCHKIRSDFEQLDIHVIYWIEEATDKLYLMAEFQDGAYDVYWIKNVTNAPADHKYKVNFPLEETEEFHGYQVFDFRYTRDMLKRKN